MKNIVKFTYKFIEENPQIGYYMFEFPVKQTDKLFLQKEIKNKIAQLEKVKPIIIQKIWLESVLTEDLSGILAEN